MDNFNSKTYISTSSEVSDKYLEIASADEKSAGILENARLWNQAGYLYVQSMEKLIKAKIANKIDVLNFGFAEQFRGTLGHSLEKSIDMLVDIYAGGDAHLCSHMKQQLLNQVLRGVNFALLHNHLRYPFFNKKYKDYISIDLTESDCKLLKNMLAGLKAYLSFL